MKHLKRGAALLCAGAMLASMPAFPFRAPEIRAAAAGVETIQTRVFRYDFGSFAVQYDTRGNKWYTEDGMPLKAATEPEQQWKRGGLTVNFETGAAYRTAADGAQTPDTRISAFLKETLPAFKPYYATEFYDKAQQKQVKVPEPKYFPLTFRVLPDAEAFTVEVLIGEHSLGQFTDGARIAYQSDGLVGYARPEAFTDAGDLTVDGKISIADAICSNRIAAEDKEVKISPLGLELADADGDGMVGAGDVRALLKELVSPNTRPYLTKASGISRIEALRGSVSVSTLHIMMEDESEITEMIYQPQTDSMEQIAAYHGFPDAEAMLSAMPVHFPENDRLLRVEEGEENDTLFLTVITGADYYQYLALERIELTNDGLLRVYLNGLESQEDQTEMFNVFTQILTVEQGFAAKIRDFEEIIMPYRSDRTAEFSDAAGKLPTITDLTGDTGLQARSVLPLSHKQEKLQTEFDLEDWAGLEEYRLAGKTLKAEKNGATLAVLPKQDALNLYFTDYAWSKKYGIESLELEENGTLRVTVGLYPYSDEMYETVFADYLTFQRDTLPAGTVRDIQLEIHEYLDPFDEYTAVRGEQWEAFQAAVPEHPALKLPGVPTGEETANQNEYAFTSHRVLSGLYDETAAGSGEAGMTGDLDEIAGLYHYPDAAALMQAFQNTVPDEDGIRFLAGCTEGEETDTWYLSFFTDETYQRCEFSGMTLFPDTGALIMRLSMLQDDAGDGERCNVFTHILTAEHGLWNRLQYYNITAAVYESDDAAGFAESYSESLSLVLPQCLISTAIRMTRIDAPELEKVQTGAGLSDWAGYDDYMQASGSALTANDGSAELAVLRKEDGLKVFFTDYAWDKAVSIEKLELGPDGNLTVTVGAYCYGDALYQTVFAGTVPMSEEWFRAGRIRSVTLVQHTYEDPFENFEAVRGAQWEAYQQAAAYCEYSEETAGIPLTNSVQ